MAIKSAFTVAPKPKGIKFNIGTFQPPIKKIVKRYEKVNIFPYSPRKNRAKRIEEYSILYPATISASASGRSKGVLFVSARIAMKKITAAGNSGIIYHNVCDCL